jgi:hypothetical protein
MLLRSGSTVYDGKHKHLRSSYDDLVHRNNIKRKQTEQKTKTTIMTIDRSSSAACETNLLNDREANYSVC